MGLRIAVYSIAKNEAQFVKRWTASAHDADVMVVADTGSTDDTVRNLTIYGAYVYKIALDPWRFDLARNIALSLVPHDIDICISLDMDEVLQEGWRDAIEKVAPFPTALSVRLVTPCRWHPGGTIHLREDKCPAQLSLGACLSRVFGPDRHRGSLRLYRRCGGAPLAGRLEAA